MGFHVLLILPYYWLTVWMYNVQMLFVIQIKKIMKIVLKRIAAQSETKECKWKCELEMGLWECSALMIAN